MKGRLKMPKKLDRHVELLRPVLHIFCEGSKTEPWYYKQYINRFCRVPSRIQIEPTKENTPVRLVKEALKRKKEHPNDLFWVVFDRESEAECPESLHQQARQLAEANGISIALSNVCFEVWLLLHRRQTCPMCQSCGDLLSRKEFKESFPDYKKSEEIVFTPQQIGDARKRAVALNRQTMAVADPSWTVPSKWNPYTDAHKVLDAIDAFR